MISEIVTLAVVVGVATGTDAAVKTGAATVEGTGQHSRAWSESREDRA